MIFFNLVRLRSKDSQLGKDSDNRERPVTAKVAAMVNSDGARVRS